VLLLASLPAYGYHRSEAWAVSQFSTALRLQEALEARPAQQLTRTDYDRVINAYRRVYLESPTSTKADPSVVAVAQLLEEMGRRFDDDEVLRAAIRQYEFLRQQYPGSKSRFGALYHIGEIYKEDLNDRQRADEVFQEFLRRYPRNAFAEQARKALVEPVENASLKSSLKSKDLASATASKKAKDESSDAAPEDDSDSNPAPATTGRLARVTGIRHWTTPGYTHIAVDLQKDVRFDSQRLDHPDRIFFDLFNTRLDSSLTGRNQELDDLLLKKLRISQFNPHQTRVVLEVGAEADFSAALLHDPPRLLIDVRSKAQKAPAAPSKEEAALRPAVPTPVESASDDSAGVSNPPEPSEQPHDDVRPVATSKSAALRRSCDDDAEDCPAPDVDGPASRTAVTTANGVKKVIVDNDDDAPATKRPVVAKLETPAVASPDKTAAPTAKKDTSAKNTPSSKGKKKSPALDADVREAQPTASGDRSLIRALGLKIGKIVIDPGHGGHDTGTIGPNGLEEKDLVLDVSQRLGKLLLTRMGAEVIYTRDDDTFIPLETRTAIANQAGADLFVSVHANSSQDPDARGVETYYLNFTSSPDALEVAARENAVSEKSIHELQDLVKKIALKEKIEESHEFAADVERSLHSGLSAKNPGLRDRGVKKAPFIVLIGANMPSILAEISFVSNPGDERKLKTPEYRQRIAESLYRGIAKYVSGLSGVKVASKIDKGEGQ